MKPAAQSAASWSRAAWPFGMLLLPLALGIALSWSPAAWSQPEESERRDLRQRHHYGDLIHIFTGDIEVPRDTVRHGSIICVGGSVRIEGEVTQDVIVILGSLEIHGAEVRQNVFGIVSRMSLRDSEVQGDLFNIAGDLEREGIYVGRQLFDLGLLGGWFPGFMSLLIWLRVLSLLFAFVLIVLIVAIAPDRVRVIADETPVRYVSAFFVGALTYVALLLLVSLALATLIGLPVIYLAYLVFKWLGLAGMFFGLGRRIGRSLGREMSPLGGVLLVYALYALVLLALSPLGVVGLAFIILFRVLFFCFFEVPAVGLVLLTRAGTRSASPSLAGVQPPGPPPGPPQPPEPVVPPAQPVGPEIGSSPPRDPSEERSD